MTEQVVNNPWDQWKQEHYNQCPIWFMHDMFGKKTPERDCKGCLALVEGKGRVSNIWGIFITGLHCESYEERAGKAVRWREDYPACGLWTAENEE